MTKPLGMPVHQRIDYGGWCQVALAWSLIPWMWAISSPELNIAPAMVLCASIAILIGVTAERNLGGECEDGQREAAPPLNRLQREECVDKPILSTEAQVK